MAQEIPSYLHQEAWLTALEGTEEAWYPLRYLRGLSVYEFEDGYCVWMLVDGGGWVRVSSPTSHEEALQNLREMVKTLQTDPASTAAITFEPPTGEVNFDPYLI